MQALARPTAARKRIERFGDALKERLATNGRMSVFQPSGVPVADWAGFPSIRAVSVAATEIYALYGQGAEELAVLSLAGQRQRSIRSVNNFLLDRLRLEDAGPDGHRPPA